ncbi:MAG: hypothetical protein AAGE85_10535 [Pseudomonadota bacterium]
MHLKLIRPATALLTLFATALGAAEDPKILDSAGSERRYLPDFSYAGYRNGSDALPTAAGQLIRVADFGAKPNDGVDDSKAVLAALQAAHEVRGPVILRFEAGRYRLSDILRIERGEIVLQGAGSGRAGTVLSLPRPLAQVDSGRSLDELRQYVRELDKRQVEPDANIDAYFSEYSWSGGFIWIQKPGTRPAPYLPEFDPEIDVLARIAAGQRGRRTIQLAEAAAISSGTVSSGDVLQIHWTNTEGPDAAIIDSIYGGSDIEVGSHHWSFPLRPLVRQTSRVESVDGLSVTLEDPLLHDVSAELPATLAAWPHLTRIGIEDLHLEFPEAPWFGHHMERGYNGIYLTGVFDSWVRNVRISNADSGILTYNSANVTLSDITTDGDRQAHYGVHMGNVHNVLAERIAVFNPVLHSLTFNTQSTKCVYKDSTVYMAPSLDQHAGANHQNLFDNVTLYVEAERSGGAVVARVFDGSGAGYWQPGHGAFNTTWNLNVQIVSGAYGDETVVVQGLDEGPLARIVGLHGNRGFSLDYRPEPYVESLNRRVLHIPSLYDYQLAVRLQP